MVCLRARFIAHAFLVCLIYAVICHEDLKASLLKGYCLSTVGQYRTYLNIVSVPSQKVESKNVKACKSGVMPYMVLFNGKISLLHISLLCRSQRRHISYKEQARALHFDSSHTFFYCFTHFDVVCTLSHYRSTKMKSICFE